MGKDRVLETIKKAVSIEKDAIDDLSQRVGAEFERAVEIIHLSNGRLICSGVGKSGLIAKKIASTMSSIGTPSIFVHPTDAIHGDLGMITKDDVAMLLSNSGKTDELLFLLPLLKRFGVPIISIVGNVESELARRSDVVLDAYVKREASPIELVPTSSTTVSLVIGDALAAGLIVRNDFKDEDFALLHPGGTIGKKLFVKVEDLMHKGDEIPTVKEDSTFNEVVYEISSKRLGIAVVLDYASRLIGIVTDGDLRRALERYKSSLFEMTASDIMTKNPKTINSEALAAKAANIMEKHSITSLVISDDKQTAKGIIHLHDILKAGVL
jgi:arabinose-5-phosphate isomerase